MLTADAGQIFQQAQQFVGTNKPPRRDQASVQNFLNMDPPLLEGDSKFIYEAEDLVTLRPGRENAWLDACVERSLRFFHCLPINVSCSINNMFMALTSLHSACFVQRSISLSSYMTATSENTDMGY